MSQSLAQHQVEIQRNREAWLRKPLLQAIYAGFYRRILDQMDPTLPGRVVEIGSGIGNLRTHLPSAVRTDLFPNPWLDVACDGYELPFDAGTISHLVLFDVFHHLQAPNAFLMEARRVLAPRGRLILFEPFVSGCSRPIYALFHHEPLAMDEAIDLTDRCPKPRGYHAAQGNATRLFFWREAPGWPEGWKVLRAEAFASFSYLLSGGFSKPGLYPAALLPAARRLDDLVSRWPRLFGARCLLVLQPK
jgi:SAM-dependent methyltransferase